MERIWGNRHRGATPGLGSAEAFELLNAMRSTGSSSIRRWCGRLRFSLYSSYTKDEIWSFSDGAGLVRVRQRGVWSRDRKSTDDTWLMSEAIADSRRENQRIAHSAALKTAMEGDTTGEPAS